MKSESIDMRDGFGSLSLLGFPILYASTPFVIIQRNLLFRGARYVHMSVRFQCSVCKTKKAYRHVNADL